MQMKSSVYIKIITSVLQFLVNAHKYVEPNKCVDLQYDITPHKSFGESYRSS